MPTHRAVHVAAPGQALALAEVETTSPQREHVRITVAPSGTARQTGKARYRMVLTV